MVNIVNNTYDIKAWNEKAIHPMQSWEWGEARKKMGIEVLRLEDRNDVYQITIHNIPHTPFKVGYLPRSKFPTIDLFKFLYDYGKQKSIVSIKIEPNEIQEETTIKPFNHLVVSPTPLFPKWTQILDLTKSEEDLLTNMKPKTRYNIRLAQKKGVKVKEETNEKGFETFIQLYFQTTKRQHYFGHNEDYHRIIFNELQNSIARIFIAYYESTPVAAYELFLFNNTLYYPYGGSSDQFRETMATNLLMWEAIRFGKKNGATSFDMWGSLPPNYNSNDVWSGFTRFKEGYGTQFTQMVGSFDLVTNPLLYWTLTAAQKIRERLFLV